MKRMVLSVHLCILVTFLLFLAHTAFAVTLVKSSAGSILPGRPQSTAITVKKTAVVIKQIKNDVLFTKNGDRYDLSGVKIRDFSGIKKVGAHEGRLAELTFVNNVLKEIIIRH